MSHLQQQSGINSLALALSSTHPLMLLPGLALESAGATGSEVEEDKKERRKKETLI